MQGDTGLFGILSFINNSEQFKGHETNRNPFITLTIKSERSLCSSNFNIFITTLKSNLNMGLGHF